MTEWLLGIAIGMLAGVLMDGLFALGGQITAKKLAERCEAARVFALSTGTKRAVPGDAWGTDVKLWRRFRDGHETVEVLPRWIAHLTLAAIPYNEEGVERAKLLKME